MKVGLISFHSFIQPGGVKSHVLGLSKEFKKRKIETRIIIPRRNWRENYGKDVILLGTSFPVNFGGTRSDFDINFNPLSIERTLRKEKFDILHFHNFILPSALQILTSPTTAKTLNVLTFHSNIEGSKFLKRFPSVIFLLNKICQWKIDGIIGVAPLTLKVFKNYKGPKTVVPNGIDLAKFNQKIPKLKKFSDRKINILFVGRIEERKGLIYLLKAFKILEKNPPPNFGGGLRLIIVGEGPLKKSCENYVRENHLKEVYFEGKITGKELPSYYASCDIFCSPAIFGESFGLVLLEAMACGKPVVAFANEGYKQFFKRLKGEKPSTRAKPRTRAELGSGQSRSELRSTSGLGAGPVPHRNEVSGAGFLAKPRNFLELAQKLEILIKNEKLRKEMGEWGIAEAKKYSWQKISSQVLNFYDFCRRNKEKEGKEEFSIGKIIEKIANKDILEWLR